MSSSREPADSDGGRSQNLKKGRFVKKKKKVSETKDFHRPEMFRSPADRDLFVCVVGELIRIMFGSDNTHDSSDSAEAFPSTIKSKIETMTSVWCSSRFQSMDLITISASFSLLFLCFTAQSLSGLVSCCDYNI